MGAILFEEHDRPWSSDFLPWRSLAVPYVSCATAVETIAKAVADRRQLRIGFCNANIMMLALKDDGYARLLGRFLLLNDGIGIDLASRIMSGRRFQENLNGTDFVPELLRTSPEPLSLYLLGGRPGVAARAAERLTLGFPRHRIAGLRDGYFAPAELEGVLADVNAARPDIVLVAMGNPLQERFIAEHAHRLDVPVLMGVGALLDFMSGTARRAPAWMRRLRLEWLHRLSREPVRLGRRYTVDLAAFLGCVAWMRLRQGALATAPLPRTTLRPEP